MAVSQPPPRGGGGCCGGVFCAHVAALTRKNLQLKRRAPLTLLLEVGVPTAIVALMLALKTLPALQDSFYAGAMYVGEGQVLQALPFGVAPRRLADAGFAIAVLPARGGDPASAAAAQRFLADMSALHPPLNFSSVGGGLGFRSAALRALYVPGFADVAATFADDGALAAHIAAQDYKQRQGIWAAVVFNSAPPSAAGWDYSVRLNASDATNTNGLPVNTFVTRYQPGPISSYVFSRGPLRQSTTAMPGFLSLQLAVDRWIIGRNVSTDALDELALLTAVGASLGLLSPSLAERFAEDLAYFLDKEPARFAAIVAELRQWMRAETFAPQQVDFVPYPTAAYKINLFYTVVLPNLTLLFVIAYLVPVTRLVRALVVEKELKLREVMRIMGLSQAAHFLSWVGLYAAIYAVIALMIALIGTQIFPRSSFGIVFALFFAFGLSSTTFCILVSVFFSRSRTATVLGGVCFFAAYFAFFGISSSENPSRTTLLGGALLAPTALGLAMDVLGSLESNGVGATPRTLFVDAGTSGLWSAGASLFMLLLDTALYAVLAWYADAVLPASWREFGVPRPFYFCCTPAFCREDVCGCAPPRRRAAPAAPAPAAGLLRQGGGDDSSGLLASLLSPHSPLRFLVAEQRRRGPEPSLERVSDSSFFEEADASAKAKEAAGRCVKLSALRKEFDTPDGVKVAVDSVDMTMYEGQIFVLLGHNGAGKTTTISMLTGMLAPTSGAMSVFGRDVSESLSEIRRDLGVCPQHDVLWPDLTVREHLQLYGALKGVPPAEREGAAAEALRLVGLTEKVDVLSETLSGGMKRKLSVAVAFLGGSRVVLLDEPTSGMDPYSRRSTWQILQNAREGRVILLTTHFMDEADILGDRIAIMAHGQVRCDGSPTFLKNRFGVGYVLTLVRAQHRAADSEPVLSLVRRHVREASVATNVGAELNLRLPMASSPAFPAMLAELDAALEQLGVVSYGISVTNIEDVFLKIAAGETELGVGASAAAALATPAVSKAATTVLNPLAGAGAADALGGSERVALFPGASLTPVEAARARSRAEEGAVAAFVGHARALFVKRLQFGRRDYRALLCLLLIPVVLLCAGLSFILVGLNSQPRDLLFSTSGFNAARYNFVTRSECREVQHPTRAS
jgi:ATP-binding cassette subfamily A (ABC1) protein 3